MTEIRYVQMKDKEFWYKLDKHLPKQEFENKIHSKTAYILSKDNTPIGLLRYNLFWDNIPFCTMLYIDEKYQKKGYGRKLLQYWETEMKNKGYNMVLTSIQVDEYAQNFYRKMGYRDCGSLILNNTIYEQPAELFLLKNI